MKESISYKLPDGWVGTTLGEVCIIGSGGTPDRTNIQYYKGNIPWIKSGELNYNTIVSSEEAITNDALDNSSAKVFPSETILVALYGATVGKLAVLGIEAATNQAVAGIICTKGLSPHYIYYYLYCNKEKLIVQRKGGAQPNINLKILNDFTISFPPLSNQQVIVSKIEELFGELDSAKLSLLRMSKKLKIYEYVILKAAFEGALTKDWRAVNKPVTAFSYLKKIKAERKKKYQLSQLMKEKTRLSEINFDIEFSQHPEVRSWAIAKLDKLITIAGRVGWKGLKKEEYTNAGPLFLSVHCLNYGKNVSFKEALHISHDRYNESPEIMLQEGDVLLCKDGSGIGKVSIVKQLPSKATINSSLLILRGKEVFTSDFLYYLLKGPKLQRIVNDRISGSAIPHLFQKDIKEFILNVPPINEQHQIVSEIEYRSTIAEKLAETIDQNIQKIEVLKQVILQNAFKDLLVSQKINDQAGKDYLAQIKSERKTYLDNQILLLKSKPKRQHIMKDKKSIIQILKSAKAPMSAKDVWLQSKHKDDIEGFYSELRELQNKITEIKKDTESLLTLRHENR